MMTPENILWYCLRNARPDGSKAIQHVMAALAGLAADSLPARINRDRADNLWIDARDGRSNTLFVAHLDTVARAEGEHQIYWDDRRIISTGGAAVLGADDGAGVYVLARMMAAKVPALYLYTQGEEYCGIGMTDAVMYERDRFTGIERAIAFDRKGTTEICGEQSCGILASRAFVGALAAGLGLGHVWGCGTYTDNSELAGMIPEIVNVSVGYANNHGPNETLDWPYLQRLADAACALDWESLPAIGPEPTPHDMPRRPGDWEPMEDTDDIVRDTLWAILDDIGYQPGSYEAACIEGSLHHMAERLFA